MNNNSSSLKDWQQWGKNPESESRYNIERVKGNLPEMESTKQLVNLVSQAYSPGMKILDVGCNVGHYLIGLRKKFKDLDYTGVDAYPYYIEKAKIAFKNDPNTHFEVRDIFKPIFPTAPFDIVYCCNVLLHLPDFRKPMQNLLTSTKKVCFIRTLFGDSTTIVKSAINQKFDDDGNPLEYWYLNTWKKEYFVEYVKNLGWYTEFISDEFDPNAIQEEYSKVKTKGDDKGTKIINDKQVIENIICNWTWAKITKE